MFSTALKIHISQCTADILLQTGSFELEERGEIEIKVSGDLCCLEEVPSGRFQSRSRLFQGKGSHKTYWLLDKQGFNPPVGAHGALQTDGQKLPPEVHQGSFHESPTDPRMSHSF